MDAHEMTTIADMLRNIVRTEMDGHFVRDGDTQPPPEEEAEEEAPRRRRGRPIDPETAWLDVMIERGRIIAPGGQRSNHYKLWFMLKYCDRYAVGYFADWLSGELEQREAAGMLSQEDFEILNHVRSEFGNYEKQFRRRRDKIQER